MPKKKADACLETVSTNFRRHCLKTKTMTRIILFFILIFSIWTSGYAQHSKAGTTMSRQEFLTTTNRQIIKGGWVHPKWTVYQILNFNDSIVYFFNNIDTILPCKYNIIGDTLIFFDKQSIKPYKSKILLLRKDTLVIQDILGTKETLGYSRKNKK